MFIYVYDMNIRETHSMVFKWVTVSCYICDTTTSFFSFGLIGDEAPSQILTRAY